MLAVLCGSKIVMAEREKKTVALVKVGSLCEIPFESEMRARSFAAGYRSGMARIWRTTYELPGSVNDIRDRGVRFAWLAHIVGRRYKDEFPELEVVICR
jgi:hypothetical protein